MAVRTTPCSLWRAVPHDALRQARLALDRGLDRLDPLGARTCPVFFRADDCGVPGNIWQEFIQLFLLRRIPLAPSLVPAWITASRWKILAAQTAAAPGLFAWHQHGRLHVNHEPSGKSMEFGPARTREHKRQDLEAGRRRLESLLGDAFVPLFTPPWNRVDGETLELLVELGYAAVSRSRNASPHAPPELPDIFVNVDLHTRKEPTPAAAWTGLLGELESGAAAGRLGIMCHHQRMNRAALDWLAGFLSLLAGHPRLEPAAMACRKSAKEKDPPGHPRLVIIA